MLKIHALFLQDVSLIINQHFLRFKYQEKQNKYWKPRFRQIDFLKYFRVCGDRTFFKFPAAPAQEYTDLKIVISESGNHTKVIHWNLQELSG